MSNRTLPLGRQKLEVLTVFFDGSLNNLIERDHHFIKQQIKQGQCFLSLETAWRTLQGHEVMPILPKKQGHRVGKERSTIWSRSLSWHACLEWQNNLNGKV